jgi:hypothetical protein
MEQVSSNDITRTKIFSSSTLPVTVILSIPAYFSSFVVKNCFHSRTVCACFIPMRVLCAHELSWSIPDEQRRLEHDRRWQSKKKKSERSNRAPTEKKEIRLDRD